MPNFLTAPITVGKNAPVHPEYEALPYTPADGTDIPLSSIGEGARAIYVGGAGNVNVDLLGGGTAVLTGLSAGQIVVVAVTRIRATSTTATALQALY